MAIPDGAEAFVVADERAWRSWLESNEDSIQGVWLVLAKKGTTSPTSLTYAEALDHALCCGWIDGQKRSLDEATFLQRFTPRRPRSLWSARNVEHIARLTELGLMRPRGLDEVAKAKADGRWERAYSGSASATVPDDLAAALRDHPDARARFDSLVSQERFAVLLKLMTAPNPETRARRLANVLASLDA